MVCGLLMFLVDVSGDHIMEAYSSIDLVMVLYVASFLLYLHLFEVSVLCASVVVLSKTLQ